MKTAVRPVQLCMTCKRELIRVWSGWARCECGQLTVNYRIPYNLDNEYAPGSQEDPWPERPEA